MTDAVGTSQFPKSTVAADSHTAGPSKARRRLILAAGAALPSIYTLASGAQTAVASHLTCVARQQTMPGGTPGAVGDVPGRQPIIPGGTPGPVGDGVVRRFTETPDDWYRAPVNVGEYDGTPAYCVTMPQSACADFAADWSAVANPKTPLLGRGVSKARDGSIWIVQGNRVTSSSYVQITNVGSSPQHYGIVYVDQAGTVATLDPNRAFNLTPVHTSCWTSVLGARVSRLG